MTTSTSDIFQQFIAVLGNEAFTSVNGVITSTLNDIQSEPQAWLNPLTAPIKGAAAVAALTAALPTLEGTSVTSAAQLVETLWTELGAKLAQATPTPAAVAATVTAAV
jgi:hypothetical protein